eukprot:292110-Hanusia_phi.AAC.2
MNLLRHELSEVLLARLLHPIHSILPCCSLLCSLPLSLLLVSSCRSLTLLQMESCVHAEASKEARAECIRRLRVGRQQQVKLTDNIRIMQENQFKTYHHHEAQEVSSPCLPALPASLSPSSLSLSSLVTFPHLRLPSPPPSLYWLLASPACSNSRCLLLSSLTRRSH